MTVQVVSVPDKSTIACNSYGNEAMVLLGLLVSLSLL